MSKEYLEVTFKLLPKAWYLDSDMGNQEWFIKQVEKHGCAVEKHGSHSLDVYDTIGVPHAMFSGEMFILYGDGQGEAWDRQEAEGRFNLR